MVRIRKKAKKRLLIGLIVVLFLIVVFCGIGYYFYKTDQIEKENKKKLVEKIKTYYSEIVEIKKDSTLYELNNDKYIEVGSVSLGERFSLEECDIDENTKYFKLKELGYFIKYENVKKADSLIPKDDRYKKYLLFNENIVTKDNVRLYRDDKIIYTLNKGFEEEIVLKDDNGYYVEYFGELFFVNKEDVLEVKEASNTAEEEASGVPVTVYHFIYLEGDNSCNEAICHSEHQIREHFNYLKENNFFTMTTTELRLYLEGKLRAPKKSILITIDDGSRAWNFVPILEEYEINATLFLISGWYEKEKFTSNYLELASHTHNLHTPGVCAGGQGSPLKCLNKDELLADLRLSREVLDGTEAFCFPFYEFNDYGISALQEAGFKMAFIGGYRKAVRGDNLFKIPRIPLTNYTTLNQYASYIN